jgi:predicted phosphodiesterase
MTGTCRLGLLSDVHGNLPALEAVLEDARRQHIDAIVVAGDHAAGGPFPRESVRLLQAQQGWMIRGNADNYLLDRDAGRTTKREERSLQWATVRWSYEAMDRETLDALASWPEQTRIDVGDDVPGIAPIRVVHGTPHSVRGLLFPGRDRRAMAAFAQAGFYERVRVPLTPAELAGTLEERVLVCGHTHIPWQQHEEGLLVVNPGSVGSPINGDVNAQYALLTWRDGEWRAAHRSVPYELSRTRAAFHERGLLAAGGGMARALLLSAETGQNTAWFLVRHAMDLAAAAGRPTNSPLLDDLWQRAVETFPWQAYGGQGRSA